MLRIGLALTLIASGCIERQAAADDAPVDPADAAAQDAALSNDATLVLDLSSVDAQPPPFNPGPEAPLARALSCDMNADDALRTTVRWPKSVARIAWVDDSGALE